MKRENSLVNKFKIVKSVIALIMIVWMIALSSCANNNIYEVNMPENLKNKMEEYANTAVEIGINIKRGQRLIISAPVECYEFARLCVKAAYAHGASDVIMKWGDEQIDREFYLNADDKYIDNPNEYWYPYYEMALKEKIPYLYILSTDPDILTDVDPQKVNRKSQAQLKASKKYNDARSNNDIPWCIVGVPSGNWAKKIFPKENENDAINKLWDMIFKTVYVNGDEKSVEKWHKHLDDLQNRAKTLNNYNFKYLHYTNSLGTDLTIELPNGHIWSTGLSATPEGISFIANMPTEEVFTMPLKTGINGKVFASLPLIYNGTEINDLSFTIENGKIIDVNASSGIEAVKDAIAFDDNACYFGEVALVPFDSPISNMQKLFYNTLYDENASCHLAFGYAYPECIKDGINMTEEELKAAGANISDQHVDFMVGTKDLQIVGITQDGMEVQIFKDGNFSI